MQALLITPNEQNFLDFKTSLGKNFIGLKLDVSQNTDTALEKINCGGPFGFFIVDAQFGKEVLEGLLNTVIDIAGERPIVICGENEDLKQINKGLLLKNPQNAVLNDLNDTDKIKKVINSAMAWTKEQNYEQETVADEKQSFIPMKIRNFFYYESFPLNVYIKIGENKHIMTLEKDTPINHPMLQKYISKKVRFLYIEKDKHLEFLEMSIIKATKFFETNREFNRKAMVAHIRAAAIIQDYISNVAVTSQISNFIDTLLDHIIEVLDKAGSLKKVYEVCPFKMKSIVSKSLLSAYTSFFIVKQLGWKASMIRKKFLFSSLIQDTFLDNDDLAHIKSLNDPGLIDFTEEEIRAFSEHPKKIAELALLFSEFPDIDFMLAQHHEMPDRKGFPNRPSPSEMQLAVCAFNLSHNFALELDGTDLTAEAYTPVIKRFSKDFNAGNFKEPLSALKRILE